MLLYWHLNDYVARNSVIEWPASHCFYHGPGVSRAMVMRPPCFEVRYISINRQKQTCLQGLQLEKSSILSHDCHMTVSWLSHDCLMTVSWHKRNYSGFGGPWVSAVSALVSASTTVIRVAITKSSEIIGVSIRNNFKDLLASLNFNVLGGSSWFRRCIPERYMHHTLIKCIVHYTYNLLQLVRCCLVHFTHQRLELFFLTPVAGAY